MSQAQLYEIQFCDLILSTKQNLYHPNALGGKVKTMGVLSKGNQAGLHPAILLLVAKTFQCSHWLTGEEGRCCTSLQC